MKIKHLLEGVEPKLPGAPSGIQVMTPQQFVAKSAEGEEPGSEEGVAEGLVGDVVVHNYTKMPIELKPGQAQIHGWGPGEQPIYRVKGHDGKEAITSNKKKMMMIAQGQGVAEASPQATFNALKGLKSWQVVIRNNYYNGKYTDYSGRYYYVLASSPEEAEQVVLDNADAILQDLLTKKTLTGKKILPRSKAVRITADRIGEIKDGTEAGRMSTMGFKKMFSPQGPMMVKLNNGAIADVQELGVAEDISRRGLLKGLVGAAGGLGVVGIANQMGKSQNLDAENVTTVNGEKYILSKPSLGAKLDGKTSAGKYKLVKDDNGNMVYIWNDVRTVGGPTRFVRKFIPVDQVNEQGVMEGSDELYGLRVGDTVKAVINGKRVQGDVIDIFPDSMEVELLLRGINSGKTVTVDVRDTEALNEQSGSEKSPYDFLKVGKWVKFGMWNKPQEHKTGRIMKIGDGMVTVVIDGGPDSGKMVDLHLGNKSLSIKPATEPDQGLASVRNKGMTEATKLPADTRELKGKELEDYLDRIRNKEKQKTDKYKLPYIHRSSVVGYYDEAGKKYNVDAIKDALKERPKSLLKKNEKMKHSDGTDEQFFNIGFAALVGIALDEQTNELIVVNTCPGAGSCKVDCFAMKGGKIQFQGPWLSDGRILTYLLNDPEGFFSQLKSEIEKEEKKGQKGGYKVSIRWHDAGDFFSPEYTNLAFSLANSLPNVDFYAYTKIAGVALGQKPKNFMINWSEGAHTSQEKQVKAADPELEKTKNSRIVPSDLFYDLLVKDEKKNLVKGPEGQWQVIPEKLRELKQRLANEYGLSPSSILSYSEWENKAKGKDKSPLKYNVIITPGEPDLTAKDPGVLSTLLLKH